jgi:hypothetical protein
VPLPVVVREFEPLSVCTCWETDHEWDSEEEEPLPEPPEDLREEPDPSDIGTLSMTEIVPSSHNRTCPVSGSDLSRFWFRGS